MADKTADRTRPGKMAFVLLTVALNWSIWIATWLAAGRPNTLHGPGAMMVAIYAGSFGPGMAAAILSAISRPGSLKEWLRGFIRFRCGWRAYGAVLLPFPLALLLVTLALGYAPRLERLHGQAPILLYLTVFPVSIFNGVATAIMGGQPVGRGRRVARLSVASSAGAGWRGPRLPHHRCRLGALASADHGDVR